MAFDVARMPAYRREMGIFICRDCEALFNMMHGQAVRCAECGSTRIEEPTMEVIAAVGSLAVGAPAIIEQAMSDDPWKASVGQFALRGGELLRERAARKPETE